jgi:hypothetical protein
MTAAMFLFLFPHCFTPTDQRAGWKYVEVPDDAPALAAPEGVEQLRSDEPFTLWYLDEAGGPSSWEHSGSTQLDFRLDVPLVLAASELDRLEVEFARPLDGAEVDATGDDRAGSSWSVPLWQRRRVRGERILLNWDEHQVGTLHLRVHHHLRRPPLVMRWRAGRETRLLQEPWIPRRFRLPRTLFYLQPAGRAIELCQAPERPLGARAASLAPSESPPLPVQLRPIKRLP